MDDAEDDHQDIKSMPVRDYLNLELMPVLLEGMKMVERKRPTDPIAVLGKYLTDYAAKQEKKEANAASKKSNTESMQVDPAES